MENELYKIDKDLIVLNKNGKSKILIFDYEKYNDGYLGDDCAIYLDLEGNPYKFMIGPNREDRLEEYFKRDILKKVSDYADVLKKYDLQEGDLVAKEMLKMIETDINNLNKAEEEQM